jgi:hypothetical protein
MPRIAGYAALVALSLLAPLACKGKDQATAEVKAKEARDKEEAAAKASASAEASAKALASASASASNGFAILDREKTADKEKPGLALLQASCDAGSELGCAGVGIARYDGRAGLTRDYKSARGLLAKSCEAGVLRACSTLGRMNRLGHGAPKDAEKAADLYKKACEGKEYQGCNELGVMYAKGEDGFPKDPKHAVELFQTGCDDGHAASCNSLSESYCDGAGVTASNEKSVQLAEKSCSGGWGKACRNLAVWYRQGMFGLSKDAAKMKLYLDKSCNDTEVIGCGVAALMYGQGLGVPRDLKKAYELAMKGCAAEVGEACATVAFEYKNGYGVEQNGVERARYLKKACEYGDELSCQDLKK